MTTPTHDTATAALTDLAEARARREATHRAVTRGQAGASSLAVADWQLHNALERVQRLGLDPDDDSSAEHTGPEPPDAA